MGAEKPPVGKIEGVLLVARGMVGGSVQRIKAVPLGLDVGAVGDGEAEPAEDLDGAVDQQGERVERPSLGSRTREGCVDGSERGRVGLCGEGAFLLLKRGRDGGAQVVEKLPMTGRSSLVRLRIPSLSRETDPVLPRKRTRASLSCSASDAPAIAESASTRSCSIWVSTEGFRGKARDLS
jgi:hypothetical protein